MTNLKLHADARRLEAEDGMVWLAEVEVPTDPVTRFRITTNNEEVVFGKSSAGVPNIYYPYPMEVGRIVRQKKGDLPQISIAVSNARGIFPVYLENYSGLIGQHAIVRMVSLGELENYSASIRFDGEVIGAEVSPSQVTFTIGAYNAKSSRFPRLRVIAEQCRYRRFGGPECGYNRSHPLATYSDCDRSYTACDARGDDEENVMGVSRQHPKRFGGFRSMPRG